MNYGDTEKNKSNSTMSEIKPMSDTIENASRLKTMSDKIITSDIVRRGEILAPAGDAACAEAAIRAGADAIYLGFSSFSARAGAENFGEEGLCEILRSAHLRGVKVYVAMNTLIREEETESFFKTLVKVWNLGADAIILQDILLGKYIHSRCPEIVLHLSTQAGACNTYGAEFAKECGFSRVILARETPLSEIGKISGILETEVFVQGALCTCFSGQCYFSSFAGGNSGNRGRCKQPCRKRYAYDRPGYESYSYALSLSDLCVGDGVDALRKAGVFSFKIEGRMRRAEYVAAAVRYYRGLFDGADKSAQKERLSDLKRTYNRGDYTKGLAFGQDSRLLSRAVQGHLGEKIGEVIGEARGKRGEFAVRSTFYPESGDAFKILREGAEIGGARFSRNSESGFFVFSSSRLSRGDEVFVTTDHAVSRRVLSRERTLPVTVSLNFSEGCRTEAVLRTEDGTEYRFQSEEVASPALSAPLTEEAVKDCFLKTDRFPLDIRFGSIRLGNVFFAKSRLNAFRRNVYEQFCLKRAQSGNTICDDTALTNDLSEFSEIYSAAGSCPVDKTGAENGELINSGKVAVQGKTKKLRAVILSDLSDLGRLPADIVIFKPDDYSAPLPEAFVKGGYEKYLYLPAFSTETDLVRAAELVRSSGLDGIYGENYGAVPFARECGCKLFAGTGFNLTNPIAVGELLKEPSICRFALSKELASSEQRRLAAPGAFVLSGGGIKLMDLCYCPFGKTCSGCDKKRVYHLTDEAGRVFPVRRYRSAEGQCRFEIYNCAELPDEIPENAGALFDRTLPPSGNYTSGHRNQSFL